MVVIASGGTYEIVNVLGGTSLDLSGGDGRSIIGYPYHSGANQQWVVQSYNAGWTFRSVSSGLYIGIDGTPGDGTPLIVTTTPTEWDIWHDEIDSTKYRVFLPNTPLNWDLAEHGNPTPGTLVTLWSKWAGTNQTWDFTPPQ
ncbi:carbohydrate-binding module family 13 protein [Jaapia argillacea MUCL 33604]|uniref:Carbohydrate-binding module family 13 protein n=1 Tax=Jaapia argillacea MUCL 33604 TaxID=933084 RepID=A0A067PH21_9AGAM|nr:carbohydrate-binding module family 13 protein [Jaapia argillacea MUCL 33604]